MFDFYGKFVVITGASSGIGEKLSKELINKGATVFGLARCEQKLSKIQENYGDNFMSVVCDVSCKNSVKRFFEELSAKNILIDVFFLNAGIAGEEALEEGGFNLEKHQQIFNVNYFGVLNFVEFWKENIKNPTHFIVTSSVNVLWAPPNGSAYAASKAEISKAFEGLSVVFHHLGAKFSSIYCGPVQTKGLKGNVPFVWSAEKMAKYMVDFSEGKRRRKYPSLFYYFICQTLRRLPYKWTSRWFLKK